MYCPASARPATNRQLLRRQPRAHFVQAVAQRAIVNRIPNAHDRAANQRRIERIFCLNFLAGKTRQRLREFRFLCRAQFHRGRNLRFGNALPLPEHLLKCGDDFRKKLCAMAVRNNEQKIAKYPAGAQSRNNLFDHRVLRLDRDCRARKKCAQLSGLRVRCPKIAELLRGRLRRALREGDIRQSVRVLEARGLQFGLPSRLFTKLLMSASCACGSSCLASSDSAPSTARFAASAFNARRAARSAASISAFAAAAIFCASLSVAARRRATSATDSRSARARSSATSFCRFASFVSASRSCASAAAFAVVALLIAELMADARRLKKAGAFFKHSQRTRPATIAKLIHLKISAAFSDAALPPSSAACAPATAKSDTNRTLIKKRKRRLRIIEPHW